MGIQRNVIRRTLFPRDHSNFTRSVLPVYRMLTWLTMLTQEFIVMHSR